MGKIILEVDDVKVHELLKPCPGGIDHDYRGGEVYTTHSALTWEPDNNRWFAECPCGWKTWGFQSEIQAILFWNKRKAVFNAEK